jgi:hypothetical protein
LLVGVLTVSAAARVRAAQGNQPKNRTNQSSSNESIIIIIDAILRNG